VFNLTTQPLYPPTPTKDPGTHGVGSLVGPTASLDFFRKISCPCRDSNPISSSPSQLQCMPYVVLQPARLQAIQQSHSLLCHDPVTELLPRIRDILGSNHGPDKQLTVPFRGFPRCHQVSGRNSVPHSAAAAY
jgi:hypothetical protein